MNINVRFFTYCETIEGVDIVEIPLHQFEALELNREKLEYERHTVFDNGVRQICLTVDPIDRPSKDDIETIQTAP